VVFIAVSAFAQTRPDFSGRWTSEPEPTTASPPRRAAADMGSGWSSNITVTQDATRLTVEYAFFARGDMQPPLKFVYGLDGSETKNSVMMGRGIQVQTSKTRWEGERLIITTVHTFEHPETGQPMTSEVKQVLSLESPASLIVETTRSGVLGGPPSTTRTIYRKQ
jgi:arylsulfatase